MSELKNCPTGIGHKRVLEIEKLEQAKLTLKHLCKNAPSVLYAEDLYMIESLIDAEIIKTETTASPRFTAEEREAMALIDDTCDAYLHNYRFGTAEYVKLYEAIATVKQMLSETPKAHTVDCSKAEKQGGKCTGYGHGEDDEPIDECKACPQNSLYGEDD